VSGRRKSRCRAVVLQAAGAGCRSSGCTVLRMMLLMKPRWTACFAAHFPLIGLRVCVLIGVLIGVPICVLICVH
jgi:hypothetical protein